METEESVDYKLTGRLSKWVLSNIRPEYVGKCGFSNKRGVPPKKVKPPYITILIPKFHAYFSPALQTTHNEYITA